MKIDFFNSINKKRKIPHAIVSQLSNKNKYEKFKFVEESLYLNKNDKRIFNIYYRRNMRVYFLFINALGRRYQQRRYFDCNVDLSLNNLRPSSTISLFHHNMTYRFDLFDLLKIIKNALFYGSDLFIESHYPKNPYNNKEFTMANLINIYMFMWHKGISIPTYFELFRKSGFNLNKFIEDNEPYIKINVIDTYCNSSSIDEVYGDIIIMLRMYKVKNTTIHPDFSRKSVVESFSHILKKYFICRYSYNHTLRTRYNTEIHREIVDFFAKNPLFGRVIYKRNDVKSRDYINPVHKYKHLNLLSDEIPEFTYFEDLELYNDLLRENDEGEREVGVGEIDLNSYYLNDDNDDDDDISHYIGDYDEDDDDEDDDDDDDDIDFTLSVSINRNNSNSNSISTQTNQNQISLQLSSQSPLPSPIQSPSPISEDLE